MNLLKNKFSWFQVMDFAVLNVGLYSYVVYNIHVTLPRRGSRRERLNSLLLLCGRFGTALKRLPQHALHRGRNYWFLGWRDEGGVHARSHMLNWVGALRWKNWCLHITGERELWCKYGVYASFSSIQLRLALSLQLQGRCWKHKWKTHQPINRSF